MKSLLSLLIALFCLVLFSSCRTIAPVARPHGTPAARAPQSHGPPPHAPAHGYRHKHQGHDLTYDAGLGVYVVLNVVDTYFHNGLYLRLASDGSWAVSASLGSGWRRAAANEVPLTLKAKKGHAPKPAKKAKKKKTKY